MIPIQKLCIERAGKEKRKKKFWTPYGSAKSLPEEPHSTCFFFFFTTLEEFGIDRNGMDRRERVCTPERDQSKVDLFSCSFLSPWDIHEQRLEIQ